MVLDYIITVWDAAEPKTYNSKVSWKKNMPLNEKLRLWLKSINIQKSWKKTWHQFFIRWISSSSLPTAQYTTNYFFSTPPLKLTVVALSVLDSALKVDSKFLDVVYIKSLQSAWSTLCERCFEDLAKMAKAILVHHWSIMDDIRRYSVI